MYNEAQMKASGQECHNSMHSASTAGPRMGPLDLPRLKDGFTSLLSQADPTLLPAFLLWVDLKVAEYKVHGYMFAGKCRCGPS